MRLLLLLAILAVFPQAARAASFDCQRAETVVEKTICGDAKLSALDDREVAAYAAAATTLDIGDTPDFRDPVADLLSQGHKAGMRPRCWYLPQPRELINAAEVAAMRSMETREVKSATLAALKTSDVFSGL